MKSVTRLREMVCLIVVAAFLVLCLLPLSVYADFKGHHAPGGWGLQSGSQAPPGSFTVTPLYSRYHADKLIDKNGNKVNVSGKSQDITVNALGLFGWWVSNYSILGANWGMLGTIAAADNSLEFAGFEFSQNFGIGG